MKAGDSFPVRYNDQEVAQMVVEEVDGDKVYLTIPATRIVMGLQTSLTTPTPEAPAVDRTFTTQPDNSGDATSPAQQAVNDNTAPEAPPKEPSIFVDLPDKTGGPVVSEAPLRAQNFDSSAVD